MDNLKFSRLTLGPVASERYFRAGYFDNLRMTIARCAVLGPVIPRKEISFDNLEEICALETDVAGNPRFMLEKEAFWEGAAHPSKGIESRVT